MASETKKLTIKKLEAEVRRHNHLYFVEHRPEISDQEFDKLVEELRARKPDSTVLLELTSDVSAAAAKIVHKTPMLSLDKCYDDETLENWANKFSGGIVATPKIDGCAVSLRYDANGKLSLAATRGNGLEGEDVSANVRFIKDIPTKISLQNVEVRGEIYMALSVFNKFKNDFANPRNLTAGAIKLKDPQGTGDYQLAFFAYDLLGSAEKDEAAKQALLHQEKFPTVETIMVDRKNLPAAFEYFSTKRNEYDFETDGIVYRASLLEEQDQLGSTAHHPRYAIAYKFQGDAQTTRLIDVEWSVSRTGAITPVGLVEPVVLSGATVRRASLHNIGLVKKLAITEQAEVLMMRRGGVIPHIESVIKASGKRIAIPKKCPSCGSPTKERDDFLFCTNPDSCLKSKVGELEHFVKVAEIEGFGAKLIEKLYEEGLVTDSAEFYQLSIDDLLQLERMGETLAAKLIRGVESKRELPLEVFLRSLGIRELGKHVARVLAGFGTLEKVQSLSKTELAEIHSFGEVIAGYVVDGLKEKRTLIKKLLKHINLKNTLQSSSGKLAGKAILFTGKLLKMTRKEALSLAEKQGAIAAQSVSKDLAILVLGDGGGAGAKLEKAKKLNAKSRGPRILTEQEFFDLLEKR